MPRRVSAAYAAAVRVHLYRQVVDGPSQCVLVPTRPNFETIRKCLPEHLCEHELWFREMSFELGDAGAADLDWAVIADDIKQQGFHVLTSWRPPRHVAKAFELLRDAYAPMEAFMARERELSRRWAKIQSRDEFFAYKAERDSLNQYFRQIRECEDEARERFQQVLQAWIAACGPDPE